MIVKTLAASVLLWSAAASALRTCVVPAMCKCSGGDVSDAAVISDVFARCSQDSIIEFSESVDYNVFSPIEATNLSNVVISLKGNWNLPQNVSAIQELVAAANGSLTWFTLGGNNVSILGTPNVRLDEKRTPASMAGEQADGLRSPLAGSNLMDKPGGTSMPPTAQAPPTGLT